ncbi:MAG TPA: hypothetical protein VIX19_17940 [Terriglobales bacterium]
MKNTCLLLAFLALNAITLRPQDSLQSSNAANAQNAAKSATGARAAKPIAALSWLVGGVWTADGSKVAPGLQRIETRYVWSDNGAFIRFNTHFVVDKGPIPTYDGSFFWDPEQSTLAMWYMDTRNSITQGPVKVDGETTEMSFHGNDFEGKPADLRVKVIRKTNDHYTWQLEEKVPQGWKQLASLEYLRLGS